MTAKRDLKRRVRQRQARTGESYVTARRHVVAAASPGTDEVEDPDDLETGDPAAETESEATGGDGMDRETTETGADAGRPVTAVDADAGLDASRPTAEIDVAVRPDAGAAEAGAGSGAAVPVVELLDVTERARRFGLLCRVTMHPSLARRVPSDRVLLQLRDLLVQTADDPRMKLLTRLGLAGHVPRDPPRPSGNFEAMRTFLQRARAGLGGPFEDGSMFVFHMSGDGGIVPIQCSMHWNAAALMLWAIDDLADELGALKDRLTVEPWVRGDPARRIGDHLASRVVAERSGLTLFVVHDGRRYAITRDEFVIGREALTADLAVKDPIVSRRHAAVVRRDGRHFLQDLESTNGIFHRGVQVDNKRIEEGDVFTLGHTELRFTYLLERTG
jgi:hypothetical protein